MMNLLRHKSRNIQFEAFHVFKVGFYSLNVKGVCCESEQGKTSAGYTTEKQGEIDHVFGLVPYG
jgi:hypothetical protein